jgi:hypothetical protein
LVAYPRLAHFLTQWPIYTPVVIAKLWPAAGVECVKPIRILIANMPRILQDMIASIISSEPRFRIVGKLSSDSDLASVIRKTRAQIVITQEALEKGDCVDEILLLFRCFTKVLAISETGREAALYQLRVERTPLGEISAGRLISFIISAADQSWPLQ